MTRETASGIDPELLERMRRGVPLRMSAMGEFMWGDEPITHERVREALRAGLDASESGEPIVRIGPQWCYLTVEDLPLRALGVTVTGDRAEVKLDDGRTVPLDLDTLWEQPGAGLRCEVPSASSGRALGVRFTNTAQMDLAPFLKDSEGAPTLILGAREVRLDR